MLSCAQQKKKKKIFSNLHQNYLCTQLKYLFLKNALALSVYYIISPSSGFHKIVSAHHQQQKKQTKQKQELLIFIKVYLKIFWAYSYRIDNFLLCKSK